MNITYVSASIRHRKGQQIAIPDMYNDYIYRLQGISGYLSFHDDVLYNVNKFGNSRSRHSKRTAYGNKHTYTIIEVFPNPRYL